MDQLHNNLTDNSMLAFELSVKYLLVVIQPMVFFQQQALQLRVKSRIPFEKCFIVKFYIISFRIKCHISVLMGTKKREEVKSLSLPSDNTHT